MGALHTRPSYVHFHAGKYSAAVQTIYSRPHVCLSVGHLHRLKDSQGGLLIEGEHWFSGPTPNSPIRWDVAAILKVLSHKGEARRRADKELVAAGMDPSRLAERET